MSHHEAHANTQPLAGPDVDVAIVAYRGWDLTRSCLEHLRRQTLEHRVILCDNGCDEGTSRRLAYAYPEVRVVRMEHNMSYSTACNAAVSAGRGELVVMMNNDVDARPDFLQRLLAPFASRPRLGSAAALLLRPGAREIDSAGLVADPTLAGFPRFHGDSVGDMASANGAAPVLTGPAGAAAAFRRAAWAEVGGLDESVSAYLEDLDLALRLRVAGWETVLTPDAVAIHVGSATFGHRSAEQRRKLGYARGYFLRRYGVLGSSVRLRTLLTEAIVAAGDMVISRDTAALTGRVDGWHAAAGQPVLSWPPRCAIDQQIGLVRSFSLRRKAYG